MQSQILRPVWRTNSAVFRSSAAWPHSFVWISIPPHQVSPHSWVKTAQSCRMCSTVWIYVPRPTLTFISVRQFQFVHIWEKLAVTCPQSENLCLMFLVKVSLLKMVNLDERSRSKQEAFRERRHLHVCALWPWHVTLILFQVKKAHDIKCRLLHCALIPGMISVNEIVCEIWPLIHFLWPLNFTCDLQLIPRSLSL